MEPRASTPEKRLEAMRLLSEAGVPTIVMAAPMVPAINDMELERILDAAAAQGAKDAGMVLLRLPGDVRDVFREWLLRHFPDRVKHVLGLVRDARGGRDNDPNFHTRFQGQGAYAVLLQQRFDLALGVLPAVVELLARLPLEPARTRALRAAAAVLLGIDKLAPDQVGIARMRKLLDLLERGGHFQGHVSAPAAESAADLGTRT